MSKLINPEDAFVFYFWKDNLNFYNQILSIFEAALICFWKSHSQPFF